MNAIRTAHDAGVLAAPRRPVFRAGPGDEEPTPIGEPPDDDSDFDDEEDDDDGDDDEDPLQARPYCAAASPRLGQGGTMAPPVDQPWMSEL